MLRWMVITGFVLCAGCASGPGSLKDLSESRGKVTLEEPRTKPGDFLIERKVYDKMLDRGPSYFVRQIKVKAVVINDEFIGFRLLELFPFEPYFKEGEIRRGDIVQQVNGLPIGRPEQFMAAWTGLKSRSQLEIQLIRNGRRLLVTWNII
jgi:hypothetical protein